LIGCSLPNNYRSAFSNQSGSLNGSTIMSVISITNNPPPVRARASFYMCAPFYLMDDCTARVVVGVGLDEQGNGLALCRVAPVGGKPYYTIWMNDAHAVFLREMLFERFDAAVFLAQQLCDGPLDDA
jgi:hypothetical protein